MLDSIRDSTFSFIGHRFLTFYLCVISTRGLSSSLTSISNLRRLLGSIKEGVSLKPQNYDFRLVCVKSRELSFLIKISNIACRIQFEFTFLAPDLWLSLRPEKDLLPV